MGADQPIDLRLVGKSTAVLTIQRPKALNALNTAVLRELKAALDQLEQDGIGQVILTGSGERSFVAGADIAEMHGMDRLEATAFARRGQRILHRLTLYPGVTIAAVNGYALGGGMELAMACDLILASSNALFGQPEVDLGVIPGFGGTQRLRRRVGAQRARELIFTGRRIGAEEAVRLGLALRVVPEDEGSVLDAALALADSIGSKGPTAIVLAKQACALAEELDIEIGLQEEAARFGACFSTEDQTEGMAAFLEKRPAKFASR
ncbi:MAG: enoyl-CoA hydratase-related protein [Myxococcota bacterium]|nr:enoyl-CoA hydratase-related protein [Myxococcota bacterium]